MSRSKERNAALRASGNSPFVSARAMTLPTSSGQTAGTSAPLSSACKRINTFSA